MKRNFTKKCITIIGVFITLFSLQAQNKDWANLQRYAKQNEELKSTGMKVKAVFIGNSITEGWVNADRDFFESNNYIGRGISGQTTPQMLLRFQADVITLKPKAVVINGGINDIAENTGKYDFEFTLSNIKSMAEVAHNNGIKVILTSVLPSTSIPWRKEIENTAEKVSQLNDAIREYAKSRKFTFVDYYSNMADGNKQMKKEYTTDGVHVTKEGYKIMESLVKTAIDKK